MREKILKLRLEGKTYNEIKNILKCSKSTISYHCSSIEKNEKIKSINLDIKNKNQIKNKSFLLPDKKILDEILNLRKLKKSYNEINKELNISLNIIKKVCRKYGLFKKRKFSEISEEKILNIRLLYSELKSTRKVSKELGISRDSVRKYVNVEYRNKLTIEELKINRSKSVVDWRKRTKMELVKYKGGCCVECGYNKCIEALQFHHLDPLEKDFTISGKSWSFERLKNEVDKCILLCANCHIEIHNK